MPRITSQGTRQAVIVGSNFDPNFPPERLSLFDEQGNPVNLGSVNLIDVWKGEYSGASSYQQGDLIRFAGYLYMAERDISPDEESPGSSDTAPWILLSVSIPPGGQTGQALVKISDTNFDVIWDLPAGSTDTDALHFLGTWVNNRDYIWGDVVIDEGDLYVLNAVDTLASFQPAPSSETDPATANWLKIATLTGGGGGGGAGGPTLLKSYITTPELLSNGSAHPTVTGYSRLPTPDQVAFNFTERTLVRILASFEFRSLNAQSASANLQLENPSFAFAQNVNLNSLAPTGSPPAWSRVRIGPTSSGVSWVFAMRSSGIYPDPIPESGLSVSYVFEPGPNSLELIFQSPGGIEVRNRMIVVEILGTV